MDPDYFIIEKEDSMWTEGDCVGAKYCFFVFDNYYASPNVGGVPS